MKTLKLFMMSILAVSIFSACNNSPETKEVSFESETTESIEKTIDPNADLATAKFEIEGMTCQMGCARVIEENLAKMQGVMHVEVNFEAHTAKIEYDANILDVEAIIASVTNTSDAYSVTSWNGEPIALLESSEE